jgi:hypothetical protein
VLGIGPMELIVVLVVALLIFGPSESTFTSPSSIAWQRSARPQSCPTTLTLSAATRRR